MVIVLLVFLELPWSARARDGAIKFRPGEDEEVGSPQASSAIWSQPRRPLHKASRLLKWVPASESLKCREDKANKRRDEGIPGGDAKEV